VLFYLLLRHSPVVAVQWHSGTSSLTHGDRRLGGVRGEAIQAVLHGAIREIIAHGVY
jgi:hypothetical protein